MAGLHRAARAAPCLLGLVLGCDGLDVGRPEVPAARTLVKLMIQDEAPARFLATDLLRDVEAYEARRAAADECSLLSPCRAGEPECALEEGAGTGYCPDLLNPAETPPAIGIPAVYGGNQLRLVFDGLLEPELDLALMSEGAGRVALVGPDGAEVETAKYYDPTGDPDQSASPILSPYGPAIVLLPLRQLSAGVRYSVRLVPEAIRAKDGGSIERDVHGEIRSEYPFVTEGLYVLDGMISPDFTSPDPVAIAPSDHFQLFTNAAIGARSAGSPDVLVRDEAGELVGARAFADCAGGPNVVDIVHTAPSGEVEPWPVGQYTIEVLVRSDTGEAVISYDVWGTPLGGTFSVRADVEVTHPIEALQLPEDCPGSNG